MGSLYEKYVSTRLGVVEIAILTYVSTLMISAKNSVWFDKHKFSKIVHYSEFKSEETAEETVNKSRLVSLSSR